jgi:hypothetical protein
MAAITKIEFWSDVGFIDGAVEIPKLSAADPINPDVMIEPDDPIMPSKDRFFSELKLKEYYTGLLTMSYMRITYDLKNSLGIDTSNVFYGWIDKVDLSSDGEYPMTIVSWHIDEWRTWKNAVTFGSGHVKRRPFKDLATTPIQNYGYNYLKLDTSSKVEIFPRKEITVSGYGKGKLWWVVFSYNYTYGGSTLIGYGCSPIWIADARNAKGDLVFYNMTIKVTGSGTTYNSPTLANIYGGSLDEWFNIPASSINGVWLTPYYHTQDDILSGTGTATDPLVFDSSTIITAGQAGYGYIMLNAVNTRTTSVTFVDPIVSEEKERWVVVNSDGGKILDLPYGMSISGYETYETLESDQLYFTVSFKDGVPGRTEGCLATITVPTLPINENALTDYVFSGQREYDREMRTLLTNANAIKSITAGAGQGAFMGAFGAAGAALGIAGGVLGGGVSYLTETYYQNDKEQELLDRLKANQIPSLIMGSYGLISVVNGSGPSLYKLDMDSYSYGLVSDTRSQFGVSVDELMSSCDTLIRTTSPTGYYNIQNMIVSGNVPVSAKKWIREKFRSGVRLI